MSSSTKRKHVTAAALDPLEVGPDASKGERVARLVAPRGNNLHEVESPDLKDPTTLENFLVSMPNKFRKSIWVKRGDFVIVSPIEEGDKVKGEISRVLFKEHIKHLQAGLPVAFEDANEVKDLKEDSSEGNCSSSDQDEEDGALFRNTNRPPKAYSSSEADSTDEEEEK